METKTLKHERFGEVRTVKLGDKIWYIARDVAAALGYKKPQNAIARHVAPRDKTTASIDTGRAKFKTTVVVISENGLRSLCAATAYFAPAANDILDWLLKETPVNNALKFFEHERFGKIRVVMIDGEAWLVGIDIATALGYQNPAEALQDHVPDKFKKIITRKQWKQTASNQETSKTLFAEDEMGGAQRLTFINEQGMYRLVLRSKLPAAEEFTDWTCEVLVKIRKTGSYSIKREVTQEPQSSRRFELAVVYVLALSDDTVKIGMTDNLTRRIRELHATTKITVLDYCSTPYMNRADAFRLETALKSKFFDKHLVGEFFSANFEEVRRYLIASPADKLIAVADKLEPSQQRQDILVHAANLLVGDNLF